MGILRRTQNRLAESQMQLETAIDFDRNNARAIFQLGHTLTRLRGLGPFFVFGPLNINGLG